MVEFKEFDPNRWCYLVTYLKFEYMQKFWNEKICYLANNRDIADELYHII